MFYVFGESSALPFEPYDLSTSVYSISFPVTVSPAIHSAEKFSTGSSTSLTERDGVQHLLIYYIVIHAVSSICNERHSSFTFSAAALEYFHAQATSLTPLIHRCIVSKSHMKVLTVLYIQD